MLSERYRRPGNQPPTVGLPPKMPAQPAATPTAPQPPRKPVPGRIPWHQAHPIASHVLGKAKALGAGAAHMARAGASALQASAGVLQPHAELALVAAHAAENFHHLSHGMLPSVPLHADELHHLSHGVVHGAAHLGHTIGHVGQAAAGFLQNHFAQGGGLPRLHYAASGDSMNVQLTNELARRMHKAGDGSWYTALCLEALHAGAKDLTEAMDAADAAIAAGHVNYPEQAPVADVQG